MTAAPTSRLMSPEEFEALEDAEAYELVDGQLKERPVSFLSSKTAMYMGRLLGEYADAHNLGDILGPDIGMQIFPGRPGQVRRPDVAFLAVGRVTAEVEASGFLRIPPDFVIEVISPGDRAADMQNKVDLYLGAGVPLVWVAYPDTRKIIVFRADGSTEIFGPDATITCETALPGFRATVKDLFPPKRSSTETPAS